MSEPATEDPVDLSAKNWIDSLTARNQWRLQILSVRYRIDPDTGERVEQPVRIRRFAEGCPASGTVKALDYLLSLAPYTGVIFNGQTLDGEYVPTLTRWSRDDQDIVSTVKGRTDGTYTLVQDLIDRRYIDEYEFDSHSSCSEKVVSSYVWDASTIEALPIGGVGESYSIQSVGRNEDGSLNYSLVHRKALTQHMTEKVVKNGPLRRETVETWDNVYPGDTEGSYVDDSGAAIAIPAAGYDPATGIETLVSFSENDDCTLKVQVSRESDLPANNRQRSSHTIYEGDHEDDSTGALLPLPLAPDASGGIIRTNESELQANGRYAVRRITKVERSVPQSSVEVRVGFRGKRITTTSTNQAEPVSTTAIGIGGFAKYERTPGGLFNNTVSTWDRTEPVDAGERCEDTLLERTCSRTTAGVSSIPPEASHVDPATGGLIIRRSTNMDDEGAITQTVEKVQEHNVESFDEEWSVSLDGITHRVVHRNRDLLNRGVAPAFSLGNIGTSVRNERTPGGLVTVTITELDRTSGPLVVSKDCSKTIYEHTDQSATTDPTGTIPTGHVSSAGGGTTYERSARMNQNGSVTVTERTTSESEVADARLAYRRTTRGLITTRTTRNGNSPATVPGETLVGSVREHEKTPGGRYNLTVTDISAATRPDSARTVRNYFESEDDAVTMTTGAVDTTPAPDASPSAGKWYLKTSDLDNDGFVKTVVRTTTETERLSADVTYRKTTRGLVTTTVDRNTTRTASSAGLGVGESQSHTTTASGRHNLTKVEIEASASPDSAYCANSWFEHIHDTVSISQGSVVDSDAPAAGSGARYTRTSDLDGDGFVKTVVRRTQEVTRNDYEKSFRKTPRGVIETTVNRSVASGVTSSDGLGVGCSKSHRMTDGGWFDVTTVTRTVDTNVKDRARCEKTIFAHIHEDVTMGVDAVDDTEPSDVTIGLKKHFEKSSEMDADGFVRTILRTTNELLAPEAEKTIRRTTRGLITTVTDRNSSSTATGDVAVGCSKSHRLNPGGTYDYTEVTLVANTAQDSAYCSNTWFEHVHDSVTLTQGSVVDEDAPAAGSGSRYTRTSDLDSDGFVKTVVRTATEVYRSDYEKSYRKTTRGLIETTVNKSASAPASSSGLGVGCSQSHRMTEGGLYDVTIVNRTVDANVKDHARCEKTAFSHVHDTVTMGVDAVDYTEPSDVVIGTGRHYEKTSDMDGDGFVRTILRTTEEIEKLEAEKSIRRTTRGLITTVTDRNTSSTATGDVDVGCSKAHRLNPGGTYDYTEVTLTASAETDSAYHARSLFEDVDDAVTMSTGSVDDSVPARTDGTTFVKTSDLDNDGFVKTIVRTTTEKLVNDSSVDYESDHFTKTKRKVTRNTTATESEKDYVAADANRIVRVSVEKTPGGLVNRTETTIDATPRSWNHTIDLNHRYQRTVWFVNMTASAKDQLYNGEKSAFEAKLSAWNASRPPSNYDCNPNVTLNRFGTFDGQFTFTASWHPESAGQNGDLDLRFSHLEYDQVSYSHDPHFSNDGTAYIRTTKITRHIYTEIGRGDNRLTGLLSQSATGCINCDYSMDPITKRFHVSLVRSQTTEVSYEERDDGFDEYEETDTP